MKLVIIAAVAQNGTIGNKNQLPWKLPTDLKRFKSLTLNHTIICGRKTFESIGRPLPKRTNVILSRDPEYKAIGATTYKSLEEALWHHTQEEIVFCIGGGEIYRNALPFASELDITRILVDIDGDTTFPEITDDWELIDKINPILTDKDELPFRFEKYIRKGINYVPKT